MRVSGGFVLLITLRRRPFRSEGFLLASPYSQWMFSRFRRPPSSWSLPPQFSFCRLLPHFRLLPSFPVFDVIKMLFPFFAGPGFRFGPRFRPGLWPPQFSFVCPGIRSRPPAQHRSFRLRRPCLPPCPFPCVRSLRACCSGSRSAVDSFTPLSAPDFSPLSLLSTAAVSCQCYRHSRRLPGSPPAPVPVFSRTRSSAARPPEPMAHEGKRAAVFISFQTPFTDCVYLPRTSPEQMHPAAFRFSFRPVFLLTLKSAAHGCDSVFLPFRFLRPAPPDRTPAKMLYRLRLCLQTSPGPSFRARVEISYLSSPLNVFEDLQAEGTRLSDSHPTGTLRAGPGSFQIS